jgi:hypothetical protein
VVFKIYVNPNISIGGGIEPREFLPGIQFLTVELEVSRAL